MISQTLKITMLYDFYGALLTERQQQCVELHYLNDWSLAEIAEEFNVSRQAIHDILKRSVQTMEEFESKLELVRRHDNEQVALSEISELVTRAIQESNSKYQSLNLAGAKISELLSLKGGT